MQDEFARNRVLDTREAADFLKLSTKQLRRLIAAGRGPQPVRISQRKLGFRVADLVALVEQRAAEARAA